MAEADGNSEPINFQRRSLLRSAQYEAGMATGNGTYTSVVIPLCHVALIVASLFIVSNAAHESAESHALAQASTDKAAVAEREARLAESKIESLRNEVSELKGMVLGKPKEK